MDRRCAVDKWPQIEPPMICGDREAATASTILYMYKVYGFDDVIADEIVDEGAVAGTSS